MFASILIAFWAIVALSICWVVLGLFRSRRHAARARRLGCKAAPRWENRLPFGIDHVLDQLRADREKVFPDFFAQEIKNISEREGRDVTTIHCSVLGSNGIITTDPKNIQALLAVQFDDFEIGRLRREIFLPLLGNGIFTSDGKAWEHSRKLLRPQFARDQINDLAQLEEHVQNLIQALPAAPSGWTEEVDLLALFFRLTIDYATEFLFGHSINSQTAALQQQSARKTSDGPDETVFAFTFDKGQQYIAKAARLGEFNWLSRDATFWRCCKQTHEFADHFVRLALNNELHSHGKAGDREDKPQKYAFLEALASETQDPIELRSQLLNILLAGRDTTASLLGWLFFLLIRHPAVFSKLRETVLDEFGSYSNPQGITFASLKNCRYMQYCLNEALRLYPVVPFNGRRAARDTTLPRGGGPDGLSPIYVRRGQEIGYTVHLMHRNKTLWGADANEFKPERWEDRKPGWEYLPFNGGPRICIGQQFALTEAGYVTVRLLQRFDGMDGVGRLNGRVLHGLTLTSCPGDGVKVRLHESVEKV